MTVCIEKIAEMRRLVKQAHAAGQTVGLVPTMGALHEGHLSLIRRARAENDVVVVSIFVNPTQFGPHEDFARYPRPWERDARLAEEAGADVVFHPSAEEMYPEGYSTWVEVEGLTEGLCGASRPGHFRGVATVVTKLLHICQPERVYFGQKDAQQLAVIRRMVLDLNFPVEVVDCPTVREADGLALSSRNVYLSPEERAQAPVLYRALCEVERLVQTGETQVSELVAAAQAVLAEAPLAQVEYVEIVDAESLEPVARVEGPCLVALAVRFGDTRLIDNVLI